MAQTHTFISYVRNEHSFTLTISGLSVVTTWSWPFKIPKVKLTISNILFVVSTSVALKLKKVKFTIANNLIKFTSYFTMPIDISAPRFVIALKQLLKITYSFKISKVAISYTMKLASKLGNLPIDIPYVSISATPIVAKFIPLSTYDPQTLSAMDGSTLQDLDYTIV